MAQFHKCFWSSILVFFVVEIVLFIYFVKPPQPQRQVIKALSGETLDYSGQYRIIRFYRSNGIDRNYSFYDVTIATQCSVNHLHHLVELLERWNGPVSCAVFTPTKDASYAADAIRLLRKCFSKIRQHVVFHFVYPSSHLGDMGKIGTWLHLSCQELLQRLEIYGYQNYDVTGLAYPHNVLRNVARSGVLTQYVLLLDIDVIPNVGLRQQFLDFASRRSLFDKNRDLTAYVLPVFEARKGLKFPKNKNELLEGVNVQIPVEQHCFQIKHGTIRPFHNETCWWCHKAENVDRWSKIAMSSELEIAFEAEWDKSWEPFYIAHRSVPMFDGRFMQYGFDRIQQICEMYVAGFNFAVLNNAFLTHHGWKFAGKFYSGKDADNAQNWLLFNYHFKDNLLLKYQTNRTCSPVEMWTPKQKRVVPSARQEIKQVYRGRKLNSKSKANEKR